MTTGEYLTPGEQEALEVKSLRKRARAVQQFLRLAEQLDVSSEQTSAVVEKIRQADADEWAQLQKAAGHLALFLADIPAVALSEKSAPLVLVEDEVPAVEATLAMPSAEIVDEPQDEVFEAAESERAPGFGKQGMAILRRLTNDQLLNAEDLRTHDIAEIADIIGRSTLSGELLDETRAKLELVLSGVPYKEVVSSHPMVANLRVSIKKAQKESALRIALTQSKEHRPLHAVPRPPARPLAYTPLQPRYEAEVEVLEGNAVSIVEEDTMEDVEAILRAGLEHPQTVTPGEWRTAAYAKFSEVAPNHLADGEAKELWDWIHFSEDKELPDELGADGRKALRTLQNLFLGADKAYFNNAPYQNIAARTLVIVAHGVKTLPEICEKVRSRKPVNPELTDNVAQRHVVAAVTHLLEQTK